MRNHSMWKGIGGMVLSALLLALCISGTASANNLRVSENLTPLDEYVAAPDDNYRYELRYSKQEKGFSEHVLYMASQRWLTEELVDRTLWEHWLVIVVPDEPQCSTALLTIGSGKNGGDMPQGADDTLRRSAKATNTVTAKLFQVPNQPLYFTDDGERRTEDAIISHNWDKYLRSGDPIWLTRLPMTKSVVRAMDTIQDFCAGKAGGEHKVDQFVVTGASKRGWTTWTTAAVDKRVVACIPVVIDLLNVVPSFIHHYEVYGFWAPAVDDYVNSRIFDWIGSPEFDALLKNIDPYSFRERLTIPKLVMNGAADQFFLNDSWQFYWDDLKGPKYLRYAPNAGHGMDNADAAGTIIAFYQHIIEGKSLPEYAWSFPDDQSIRVTANTAPKTVKLWQATNPEKWDFMLQEGAPVWTETVLEADADGAWLGRVDSPEKGFTAFLVELTFPGLHDDVLVLTSPTRVTPNTPQHHLEMPTDFSAGFLHRDPAP